MPRRRFFLLTSEQQVTDTRESRPPPRPKVQRTGTRLISVDNVLQHASEIPSGQRRDQNRLVPADPNVRYHHRTPSGRHPLDPKLSGRNVPLSGSFPPISTHLPARSSKTSEKLVLLPEAEEKEEKSPDSEEFGEDEDAGPPRDEEIQRRRMKLAR